MSSEIAVIQLPIYSESELLVIVATLAHAHAMIHSDLDATIQSWNDVAECVERDNDVIVRLAERIRTLAIASPLLPPFAL